MSNIVSYEFQKQRGSYLVKYEVIQMSTVLHIQSNMFKTLAPSSILVFEIREQYEDL